MSKIWMWLLKWIVPAVVSFIKEVFTEARQRAVEALKDIAIEAVTELAKTDLSNDVKRKSAIEKIKNYAISRGMDVKDSTLALIVEMAVAKIKG